MVLQPILSLKKSDLIPGRRDRLIILVAIQSLVIVALVYLLAQAHTRAKVYQILNTELFILLDKNSTPAPRPFVAPPAVPRYGSS